LLAYLKLRVAIKEEGLTRDRLRDSKVLGEETNVDIFQKWTTSGPSKR